MPDNLTPKYTKEELDAAKEELSKMKPEDLLLMQTELSLARDAVSLPEAPAIAFMELRATSGAKVNLTVRATNGPAVLDALAIAVAYARDRYAMSTVSQPMSASPLPMAESPAPPLVKEDEDAPGTPSVAPVSSQPQLRQPITYIPASQPPVTEIQVTSISREKKRDGKGDYLRVRGGRYVKWGAPCYQEHIPQGLDITKMQYGLEYTSIPAFMAIAVVTDDKPNRVIAFHS